MLTRLHADALLLTRATGVRIGELRDLELDCVHQIDGHGAWLKVPLGKLASERMVPLDEETVAVIDRIVARRTSGPAAAAPAHRTTGRLPVRAPRPTNLRLRAARGTRPRRRHRRTGQDHPARPQLAIKPWPRCCQLPS